MKKLLVLVFVIALCLGVLCLGASAAGEHTDHNGWNELTAAMLKENNYTLEPGRYYLSEDVTCTGPITFTGNNTSLLSDEVTICLNGHVLDLNGHYIKVTSNNQVDKVSLTLRDCTSVTTIGYIDSAGLWHTGSSTAEGTTPCDLIGGVITGGKSNYDFNDYGGAVYVEYGNFTMDGGNIAGNSANMGGGVYADDSNGTVTMKGGTITGNTATNSGGGVFMRGHRFYMYGGTITGNTATYSGGGVYVQYGTFEMYSGSSITGNTASYGGGVYVSGNEGTFTLSGGSITENKALDGGGGVYVAWGTFNMSGGSITGNRATGEGGGGVYVYGGDFEMSGSSSIITNNTASNGGGVYLDSGTFTMNDGSTITGNTASVDGGGVYVTSNNVGHSGTFTMNDGSTITGNSANGDGGGVYVTSGNAKYIGTFTMNSGSITGNTAANGGGVYVAPGSKTGSGGTFTLSGGTISSNKTAGNAASNVYLYFNKIITIDGELPKDSPIGISMASHGVFTSGWSNKMGNANPESYFSSEKTGYHVALYGVEAALVANSYTVTFNANGGTGTMANQTLTYDTPENLTDNTFTRTGYRFDGWNTEANGSGTSYSDEQVVNNLTATDGGNITLYAKWTVNTYTVVFDANDGTDTKTNQSFIYDQTQALTRNTFTRTGYSFDGWSTTVDGTGTSYDDGAEVKNLTSEQNGSVTLYAKWTANTYTVKFDPNGGTGIMADQTFTYDTAQNLTDNGFTRTGYTFDGWNTAANGSGVHYSDKQEVKNLTADANGSVKLYAQWTVNTYSVTLNLNGGRFADGAQDVTSYTYGTVTLLPDVTRSGYRFEGWYADEKFKDGPYTEISDTDVGDKEFYARWTMYNIPETHEIIVIDPANGTVKVNPSNGSAATLITVTATPDEGYELAYITVDGEKITGNTFRMPDKSVTVTAVFVPEDFPFVDVTRGDWFYDAVAYVYANGLMDGTSATTFEPNANMTRAMVWAILARIDGEAVTGANWIDTARAWAMAEGVSDGTDPNGLVTREQFVTMLYRYAVAKGYDVSIGESTNILSYADFDEISEWAIPAMQWGCGSGVITGVTESTLVPQGTATRAQCAAMLMRFVENVK